MRAVRTSTSKLGMGATTTRCGSKLRVSVGGADSMLFALKHFGTTQWQRSGARNWDCGTTTEVQVARAVAGVRCARPRTVLVRNRSDRVCGVRRHTRARVELRYEVLLTQKWILQPKLEANFYSKNDPQRGIGSGLSDLELGVRLRYEVTRQFAPYLGVTWSRKIGNTATYARQAGERVRDTQFVAGVRFWF